MLKQRERRHGASWDSSRAPGTFRKRNGIERHEDVVDLRGLTRDPYAAIEEDYDEEMSLLDSLYDED